MPIIQFHVYQHTSHCTVHARHPFNENKHCQLYEASIDTKLCVGVIVAYMPKACICHYYHGISVIEKTYI